MQVEQAQWVEEIGVYFEQTGLAKSIGRIVGLLMISPTPLTLDDLARELSISKASASLGTRFGEQAKFIKRVSQAGERKTLYQMSDDFWVGSLAARLESYRRFRNLVASGLKVLPAESTKVRQHMEDMRDFITYYLEEYPKMYAQWMEQRHKPTP